MDNLKQIILDALKMKTHDMSTDYFSAGNFGVSQDHYEEIADEVVAKYLNVQSNQASGGSR